MDIFDQLKTVASDHETLWAVFRSSEQAAQDVAAAVRERIRRDKQAQAEMVATLTAQSQDSARPEVIRRLAKQELSRLETRTFGPSDDEINAFNGAVRDASVALGDFIHLESKLRELFQKAKEELDDLRKNTLGNTSRDWELARNRLERTQKELDRVLREVGE